MSIKIIKTTLPGVVLIEPNIFEDQRGYFLEAYHCHKYSEKGIERVFVQDNLSHSMKWTVRGLHYQLRRPQAKLVYVVTGEIYDVAVDIRQGSPTFGKWLGTRLSMENKLQIFIPEGFAHGYCVLSETANVIYKCTDFYDPNDSLGILWSDPSIGIEWPVQSPILSIKDSKNPRLNLIPETSLPNYKI